MAPFARRPTTVAATAVRIECPIEEVLFLPVPEFHARDDLARGTSLGKDRVQEKFQSLSEMPISE